MAFRTLEERLAADFLAHTVTAEKAPKEPEDLLKGLTPAQAQAKAEEILKNALEAEAKINALKEELAPILKLANKLGTSRRFQQMVEAMGEELEQVGSLYVKIQETSGHWKTGTQDQLIAVVKESNPELEELLKAAQLKAKTFNEGSSKVQVWDKKPADQRKKAPVEIKLASFDKDAGIWDVLYSVYKALSKLSPEGVEWMRSLFASVYETYFQHALQKVRNLRMRLESAVKTMELGAA